MASGGELHCLRMDRVLADRKTTKSACQTSTNRFSYHVLTASYAHKTNWGAVFHANTSTRTYS